MSLSELNDFVGKYLEEGQETKHDLDPQGIEVNETRLNPKKSKKTASSSSMSMMKARKSSLTDLRKMVNQDESEPGTMSYTGNCTKKEDSGTLISQKFYSNDESSDLGSLFSRVTTRSTTMRSTDKVTDKCFETLDRISFLSVSRVKEYAQGGSLAIRMKPKIKKDLDAKSKSLAYCIPVW